MMFGYGSAAYRSSTTLRLRLWDAERALHLAEKTLAEARLRLETAKREAEEATRQPTLAAEQPSRPEQSTTGGSK